MNSRAFEPVRVILPDSGRARTAASAFEALECLLDGWPIVTSSAYRRAVRLCRDALDGVVRPPAARKAFLAAAAEAAHLAPAGALHRSDADLQRQQAEGRQIDSLPSRPLGEGPSASV